jgi:hypothetical protein
VNWYLSDLPRRNGGWLRWVNEDLKGTWNRDVPGVLAGTVWSWVQQAAEQPWNGVRGGLMGRSYEGKCFKRS